MFLPYTGKGCRTIPGVYFNLKNTHQRALSLVSVRNSKGLRKKFPLISLTPTQSLHDQSEYIKLSSNHSNLSILLQKAPLIQRHNAHAQPTRYTLPIQMHRVDSTLYPGIELLKLAFVLVTVNIKFGRSQFECLENNNISLY